MRRLITTRKTFTTDDYAGANEAHESELGKATPSFKTFANGHQMAVRNRASIELKLLALAMHPDTPDAEALAAVRKLGAITNKRGGIKYLVCNDDQGSDLSADKQLVNTLALRHILNDEDCVSGRVGVGS